MNGIKYAVYLLIVIIFVLVGCNKSNSSFKYQCIYYSIGNEKKVTCVENGQVEFGNTRIYFNDPISGGSLAISPPYQVIESNTIASEKE